MTTVLIRRLCEDIERMAYNSRSGGWSHTAKGPRSPRTVGKTEKEGRKAERRFEHSLADTSKVDF